MQNDRVVITGIGTINSLGHSVDETWRSLMNGESGVGPLTLFDSKDHLVKIACEVKSFQPEDFISAREARRRDRFQIFSTIAAAEAINQSGLSANHGNPGRVGVIVSSSIGGITVLNEEILTIHSEGPRRISPFAIPMMMANGAAGMIAIDYGFKGPCFSIASACASGSDGIGTAWQLIRHGVIDAAIAGGSEATITPIGVAAFDRVGAMSRANDDYSTTPKPFDLNRDGLVMGEGAAILVLESERYALARGANILAELAGYAATGDAVHITAPAEDGSGGAMAIVLALEYAGIDRELVDYINAHGTGTQLNDLSETKAVKQVFGERAYHIPISSTKSATGHMMGATGALEAIFCVLTIKNQCIPATIHYQTPDPDCDLDYVPNYPRSHTVEVAVSNSFGFGGHNSVLVLRKYK